MNKDLKSRYKFLQYNGKSRWMSYWHQINEVLSLKPKNVLEIGIGNKTVANYLKSQGGVEVITFDKDEKLKPDVVGDVLEIPFGNNSFDVILCAEVLEHLFFNDFENALYELKRVSKKYVVLSLPHFGHSITLSIKIPLIKEKRLAIRIPHPIAHKLGEHYWEVGKRGYSLSKIKKILKKYFKIKKDYIPFENQYHHFFILEK